MVAFAAPHRWAVGDTVTAANLNTLVSAAQFLISGTPTCLAGQVSTTTSIAVNSWTTIVCDTVLFDTDSGYSTSTGRYTAQTAGWYFIGAQVNFSNSSPNSFAIRFIVNGTASITGMASMGKASGTTELQFSRLIYLGKGDYAQPQAWCSATASSTVVSGAENSGLAVNFIGA